MLIALAPVVMAALSTPVGITLLATATKVAGGIVGGAVLAHMILGE